jgi:hypothetical protein
MDQLLREHPGDSIANAANALTLPDLATGINSACASRARSANHVSQRHQPPASLSSDTGSPVWVIESRRMDADAMGADVLGERSGACLAFSILIEDWCRLSKRSNKASMPWEVPLPARISAGHARQPQTDQVRCRSMDAWPTPIADRP